MCANTQNSNALLLCSAIGHDRIHSIADCTEDVLVGTSILVRADAIANDVEALSNVHRANDHAAVALLCRQGPRGAAGDRRDGLGLRGGGSGGGAAAGQRAVLQWMG